MTIQAYAVFFPASGNAMTSDRTTTFSPAASVDFFPNTTGLVTNCFFPISDWSTDVDQTLSIGSSGSGAGKIVFNPITLSRVVDNISSAFLVLCAQGTEFKYVDLLVTRSSTSTSTPSTYIGYRFGQAALQSVTWKSDEESTNEVLALEYGTLDIGYAVQKADGTYSAPTFRGWDRINNARI